MNRLLRTARKGKNKDRTLLSDEFVIRAVVDSMTLGNIIPATSDRKAAILKLYTEDPIMLNGETGHVFFVYVPNYNPALYLSIDRMRFWLCYGWQSPVMLDDYQDIYVPLIDEKACEYFTGRQLRFTSRIIRLSNSQEVLEIDFYNERK